VQQKSYIINMRAAVRSAKQVKGKGNYILFMEHPLTATECHLPHGITQCYLLSDTSEHTPPSPQPDRPVLDLPCTQEGWKVELT